MFCPFREGLVGSVALERGRLLGGHHSALESRLPLPDQILDIGKPRRPLPFCDGI